MNIKNTNNVVEILPIKGFFKAAVAISFDYETSAQSPKANVISRLKTEYFKVRNWILKQKSDLSGYYGRGYSSRYATQKIVEMFQRNSIHGTWFVTGHAMLKSNTNKNRLRINQKLIYATKEAGFTSATSWRVDKVSFFHEPFNDYYHSPFYYLGDQTELLKELGEDIQCHSFSHPYIAMEPAERLRIDLNEWQNTAIENGFLPAKIFAFPFLSDYYRYFPICDLKAIPIVNRENEQSNNVGLSVAHLDALMDNGIELFTRCGSKQNHPHLKSFSKYNNTNLFFMKDIGILSFKENNDFIELLDQIIAEGFTLDFWLHPNDVYNDTDFIIFKERIEILHSKCQSGLIWLATINEQWERFKATCSLVKYEKDNNEQITVRVTNPGQDTIYDLALEVSNNYIPFFDNSLYQFKENRLVIRKINSKEIIDLILIKNNSCTI